jgi:hypothetical protein
MTKKDNPMTFTVVTRRAEVVAHAAVNSALRRWLDSEQPRLSLNECITEQAGDNDILKAEMLRQLTRDGYLPTHL